MSQTSRNRQAFKQDRKNLLEDIQKGIKLKSSKHLTSDRSTPAIKGVGSANRVNNSSDAEILYYVPNGPFQNKSMMNSYANPLRSSVSSSNIPGCKPPILHPKPKLPLATSTSNISRNHFCQSDTSNLRATIARLNSIDGSAANACRETNAKSSVEYFVTMKRSHGKQISQNNRENLSVERPRSSSFQQNRLVISSLFDNVSTSHMISRKSSSVINSSDSHTVDGVKNISDEKHNVPEYCGKVVSRINNMNNHVLSTTHLSNNNYIPRSSRPLPPLPTKAPPNRSERDKYLRKTQISFEERFIFHGEKDFPKPLPFVGRKKPYHSTSSNNHVNRTHHSTHTVPLVTTV